MLSAALYARVQPFSTIRTRDRGCSAHPAFPAPSGFGGRKLPANLGRNASREREGVFAMPTPTQLVMPGLDPGIHHSSQELFEKMDCRVKPGNDRALPRLPPQRPLNAASRFSVVSLSISSDDGSAPSAMSVFSRMPIPVVLQAYPTTSGGTARRRKAPRRAVRVRCTDSIDFTVSSAIPPTLFACARIGFERSG